VNQPDTPAAQPPRWPTLVAYGGLAMPLAMIGLPLSIFLAPFYAGEIGLPLALLGTAMLIGRFSDIVTDPLIGMLSDRWRPGIGRRRVWILIGAPVLAGSVWMLFNPLAGAGIGYFLLWLALVYIGFTMVQLPYQAWGGELTSNYEERSRVTSVRQLFGISGLILSTALPAWVLSRAGAGSADVLYALSLLMVIALPAFGALLYFGVPDTTPAAPPEDRLALARSLRQLWRNGPFKRLGIVMLIAYAAETFRITITVFFASEVIGISNVGVLYVYYFIAGFAAVPAWTWLGNRLGKHRALMLAFAVVVTTNIGIFFLESGQERLFVALFVAKGLCFGALELLPASMFADTADVDTVMSGEQRQGLIFAGALMVFKMGQAIGAGLSLNLLGLVGFDASGGNDADALLWLRIFYCLLPSLILAVAIALLWRYPLTAARHRRFQAYVDRRMATGRSSRE
jgi:glycoside/pentoside/hexuronide:cation symporter, GPH family